jgi:tetratricopeptide (TPR) repeat protein
MPVYPFPYKQALGPDHTSTLSTVHNLGGLYADQGKTEEAKTMFQRALAWYEKALQSEDISSLNIVRNVGVLYRDQGKTEKAKITF